MPGVSVFIDSNVLLYARDEQSEDRAQLAAEWLRLLLDLGCGRTSLQALNEVTSVLLRKRTHLTAEQVFEQVDDLRPFGSTPVTWSIVSAARTLRIDTRYAWWDCLLLASALDLGCTHFLSEDMQDGQTIADGSQALTIVDPFAHSPLHIFTHH
jgi:predicted nucleic acid-binding protein